MSEPMTPQADSGSVEGLRAALERIRDMTADRIGATMVGIYSIAADALSTPPPPVEGGWRPDREALRKVLAPSIFPTGQRWGDAWPVAWKHLGKWGQDTVDAVADAILALPSPARTEGAELSSDNPSKPKATPGQADVREALETLRSHLTMLDSAAMPTKCEVFALGGRPAREMHRAIETVTRVLATPPEGEVGDLVRELRTASSNRSYIDLDKLHRRAIEALSRQAATTPVGEREDLKRLRDDWIETARVSRMKLGLDYTHAEQAAKAAFLQRFPALSSTQEQGG